MMYKAKVAVCSDIHTKHSTQSERHVEFLNFKLWWYVKKPPGFKSLNERPLLLEKNSIFIMELLICDMVTIPEFLEGIWFES